MEFAQQLSIPWALFPAAGSFLPHSCSCGRQLPASLSMGAGAAGALMAELKTWQEFVKGDFMPKLSGDQQGELVKFLKSLGYDKPMDAAETNEGGCR